jgi:hypothetical protein
VAFRVSSYGGPHGKYLKIVFSVRDTRLEGDARFVYFFAVFDVSELRLHDPCFLIPSDVFHKIGRSGRPSKGLHWFSITASLEANSQDKWSRFRVPRAALGSRLLEIIDDAPLSASRQSPTLPPGSVWLGRSSQRIVGRRTARAA